MCLIYCDSSLLFPLARTIGGSGNTDSPRNWLIDLPELTCLPFSLFFLQRKIYNFIATIIVNNVMIMMTLMMREILIIIRMILELRLFSSELHWYKVGLLIWLLCNEALAKLSMCKLVNEITIESTCIWSWQISR